MLTQDLFSLSDLEALARASAAESHAQDTLARLATAAAVALAGALADGQSAEGYVVADGLLLTLDGRAACDSPAEFVRDLHSGLVQRMTEDLQGRTARTALAVGALHPVDPLDQ